ncbi:MAG: DUF5667 domain-containing protein [bacterium]|nr:DUF5667 domain-containing protein [bacterium]
MTKKKNTVRLSLATVFLFALIALNVLFPYREAKAFSFRQIYSPVTSFLSTVGEKIQYVFAFTLENKVDLLGNQAEKRLLEAQQQAQNNADNAEKSIQEYQDIKNKQSAVLNKVDNKTLQQVQEKTIEEQKTLVEIGNTAPSTQDTVKTVNENVVNDVKNTITLKEGTTAGEAFDKKATIEYAPGTGPSKGPVTNDVGILVIEGGGSKSGDGEGGVVIEGGQQYIVGE